MMQCAVGAVYTVMHVCCTYSRYSHSMAAGACAAILACFCFPKLLKVEGYDFGGEGGDARVEVVARNGRHL